MSDFTVSPPDLTGFGDQIADIGDFYAAVGDQAAELSTGLSLLPVPMGTSGQLSGVLALFLDDFFALVEAERNAAGRLAEGLGDTGQALAEVALSYERQDEAAKRHLEEAGSSEDHQAIDDAIREGEPNFDWSARLNGDDVFAAIDFELPKMVYQGEFGDLNVALSVVGNLPLTIDALIEALFGFSILKSLTEPLLGNWGFLWVMRDICAAEATAFETASTALGNGVGTLLDTSWTGDAASAFAGHVEAARVPLDAQVANLRTASTTFDAMANRIDKAGNDLASLIAELINLAVAVYVEAANVTKWGVETVLDFLGALSSGASAVNTDLWTYFKSMLGPLVGKIVVAVESLIGAIDAATTSTKSLCDELDALTPPALPSGEAGDESPGEPEGLTEERKDPADLTEEPNDGAGSEEALAGSPQSQH